MTEHLLEAPLAADGIMLGRPYGRGCLAGSKTHLRMIYVYMTIQATT